MNNNTFWQTKLHARLHDPAEKPLVLLRDPEGHENGTCRALQRDLGFGRLDEQGEIQPNDSSALNNVLFSKGIPHAMFRTVKRADWWAAAADRPQWPLEEIDVETRKGKKTLAVANYAQVHWTKRPVLKHPLTGQKFDLKTLVDTNFHDIKQRSEAHFQALAIKDSHGETDWQRTLLAYWRFGPELAEEKDSGTLGQLWPLLPADTRVPDHSIWDHLDLTSAFAGAFAGDQQNQAALLTMSIGPVQEFISAARSTSDLWAGSHLLSRLSWETMRVICEELGPDAILFPRLRGIPQVDVWLRDDMNLPKEWFDDHPWAKQKTDANPLFAGALPNRFVAAVPADQAQRLAELAQQRVREWLREAGERVVEQLLRSIDQDHGGARAYRQMREQLEGFPEVHWAAVPFSLIAVGNSERDTDLDTEQLSAAMRPFFETDNAPGFLGSSAWQALSQQIKAQGTRFFSPNPGVLYPAIHDLAERALAAAKATRPFQQTRQDGWRCSLSGEAERLALDDEDLFIHPSKEEQQTLWNQVAKHKKAWAKPGEHLAALPAIKRLWPTLFAAEVADATNMPEDGKLPRFVVSTHTMALAGQLSKWLERADNLSDTRLREQIANASSVPLPRHLAYKAQNREDFDIIRRIPGLLEDANDASAANAVERARATVGTLLGEQPEAYYSLLMLDGDHMGRILGGDPDHAITYQESFHPQVKQGFERIANQNPQIKRYGDQKRALSPGRHMAISAALNDFTLHVVPEVVEREHAGRLLYAGGDDVLAMLPVGHLLSAMHRLRNAYSGRGHTEDWTEVRRKPGTLHLRDGYAYLRNRLMRMMGERATASAGAVIAHHQAPLNAVRRALDTAEKQAKNAGGRDAFTLTVVKRSGGDLQFTAKWTAIPLLEKLVSFIAHPATSRRAVYHSLDWLRDLPANPPTEMLSGMLAYQFKRQCGNKTAQDYHDLPGLAEQCAMFVTAPEQTAQEPALKRLANLLATAEFLAREGRAEPITEGDDAHG